MNHAPCHRAIVLTATPGQWCDCGSWRKILGSGALQSGRVAV